MTISLFAIRDCLEKEDLLKEFISPEGWHLTLSDTLGQRSNGSFLRFERRNSRNTLFVKD